MWIIAFRCGGVPSCQPASSAQPATPARSSLAAQSVLSIALQPSDLQNRLVKLRVLSNNCIPLRRCSKLSAGQLSPASHASPVQSSGSIRAIYRTSAIWPSKRPRKVTSFQNNVQQYRASATWPPKTPRKVTSLFWIIAFRCGGVPQASGNAWPGQEISVLFIALQHLTFKNTS